MTLDFTHNGVSTAHGGGTRKPADRLPASHEVAFARSRGRAGFDRTREADASAKARNPSIVVLWQFMENSVIG